MHEVCHGQVCSRKATGQAEQLFAGRICKCFTLTSMPRQQTETMEQSYEIIKVLNNMSRENALVRLAGRLGCFSHLGAATLLLAVDEDHPGSPDRLPYTCKRQLPWHKRQGVCLFSSMVWYKLMKLGNLIKHQSPDLSPKAKPQKPQPPNWKNPACRSTGFAWFEDHVRTLLSMGLEATVQRADVM